MSRFSPYIFRLKAESWLISILLYCLCKYFNHGLWLYGTLAMLFCNNVKAIARVTAVLTSATHDIRSLSSTGPDTGRGCSKLYDLYQGSEKPII